MLWSQPGLAFEDLPTDDEGTQMTKQDLMEKFKPAFTLTDFVWLRVEVIEELPAIKYPADLSSKSAKKSARLNKKLDCRYRQPQKVLYRYVA